MKIDHPVRLAALAVAAALAGCGGGGGDDSPELPQGIWQSADRSVSALVLPNASGGELWAVVDGSALLHAAVLNVSGDGFVGDAQLLQADGTRPQQVELADGAANTLSMTRDGGAAQTLSYRSPYDTTATLADWGGQWEHRQAAGPSTVVVTTLEFGSDGRLVGGSRTSGCTYTSGSVALRPERKSVVDVKLTEVCNAGSPTEAKTEYVGVGSWGVDADGQLIDGGRMLVLKSSDQPSVLQLRRPQPN